MKLAARLALATTLAVAAATAVAAPASAATPVLAISSGPLAPDATVAILGGGCPAWSPISIDIWDTSKPVSHHNLNNVTTAGSTGAFGYSFDLDNQFDPGAEIGVFFSCTATVNWSAGPDLVSAPKYVQTTIADPMIDITGPTSAAYGVARTIVVRTDAVFGNATLSLDGTPLAYDDDASDGVYSVYGYWVFHLPASLAVGNHTLSASWTPTAPSPGTVTDTQTLRITKAVSHMAFRSSTTRIRRDRAFAVRVTLTRTGIAPRTGVVEIRDGSRTVKRITLRASDNGTRRFQVRLPRLGPRNVKAVYLGNAKLASSRSTVTVIRVRR